MTEPSEAAKLDVGMQAHAMCDLITQHGGTVCLDNNAWNQFEHMLWNVWMDGYQQGRHLLDVKIMQNKDAENERLREENEQLKYQLSEGGLDCERCGDTGKVYYTWRTFWGSLRVDKETSPCPDCSTEVINKVEGGD